ncbi:MAG: hypothetical protein ABJQ70_01885 [Roseobacter sp.]
MRATLRIWLVVNEIRKHDGQPVHVRIAAAIWLTELKPFATHSKRMMDFLGKATYELSSDPEKNFDLGHEFEERHRF